MSFKDMVEADRAVFINGEEFAEEHLINGSTVNAVLQEENAEENDPERAVGKSLVTVYARTEDLPTRRMPGDELNVDHVNYTVERWEEAMGISTVYLSIPAIY